MPISKWTKYTRPTGWETDDTGCKDAVINYETDVTTMVQNKMQFTQDNYWVASRSVDTSSDYGCYFNINIIGVNGQIGGGALCVVTNGGKIGGIEKKFGFRVCIALNTDTITIMEGKGTKEEPYIIKNKS